MAYVGLFNQFLQQTQPYCIQRKLWTPPPTTDPIGADSVTAVSSEKEALKRVNSGNPVNKHSQTRASNEANCTN